jgi:SPP1 family phage portal protein
MDIRVKKGTPLTIENLNSWILEFEKTEKVRRELLRAFYLNSNNSLKLPFAKKLVLTSASATVGDGVTFSEPQGLSKKQKALYDKLLELYDNQQMITHDKKMVIDMCATSTAYELIYMSDDEVPVPKTAKILSENAFIVFDNTVEQNSLYAVWFEKYKQDGKERILVNFADTQNTYTIDCEKSLLKQQALPNGVPHFAGRVPLSKGWNNDEEQADFEQVIELIKDRSTLHDLTLADTKKIVKNILALVNAQLAGKTKDEKRASLSDIGETPVLELNNPNPNVPASAYMLSKNENYGMIDSFGRDVDSKIYDLTMIPDLSSETFAGNVTGVALELKLLPFKELVKLKEENLRKLYRRRNKIYANMLTQAVDIDGNLIESDYEWFNTDLIEITVHRNWTKNLVEIATMIATLKSTGLYSDKYLTNLMPDADFEAEKEQKLVEAKTRQNETITATDPNNFSAENLASLFRGYLGADNGA